MAVYDCKFCGAQATEVVPHGEHEACPHQAGVLLAQKNLLEAQAEATKASALKR